MSLTSMWLVFFVETVDEANRRKFEATHTDPNTGVTVQAALVVTGGQ